MKREMQDSGRADKSDDSSDKGSEKPKAYTIKYKRPRGSRACTVCRARKVRCDAEIHIPCTNCITFGCECVLPETRKRGVSVDPKKKAAPVTAKPQESAPHTHTHLHPQDAQPVAQEAPSGLKSPTSGTSASEPIHNISQRSVPPSLTSSYKNRPSMHKREMMHSNPKASVTFIGSSSIGMISQKVGQNHIELGEDLFELSDNSTADSVELEILKLRGAFLLPPEDLTMDLIDSYFEHVHPLMPVINRTEFMAKVLDPNDSPSLMLLQAVLLCGSRVSSNPLLFDNKGSSDLASLTFFRRAKALYETNYESDPVSIVQTVLLIGSFWEGPEDVTRNSYYWTRVGIGLAQGFGFHRDISSSSSISDSEKKVWRRIWWSLFEKDRNVSIAFGRPSTIDLTDSDVPMLTLEDFDESDPKLGIVSPYPVNRTHALYFIQLVKLAEITGIIIKHQYTVKAEQMKRVNKFSIIQRCDMLMGVWFTNLPEELQFSLTDTSKQNFYSCLLNAQYYNRLYLIHRANLLRMARSSSTNPNNYKYPSWGISFQAARMISIVSKILLDKGLIKYCPVMFVYILFSSLIMLIYHVDSPNPVIASTASDSLFISHSVLKELGKHWQVVGVLLKLFEKHANDKIKRAQVIENGSLIAELEEKRATVNPESATGISYSSMQEPKADTPGFSSAMGKDSFGQGNGQGPDFEQLVKQYKKNGTSGENDHEEYDSSFSHGRSNAAHLNNTPSSSSSFPDIALVTDNTAPKNNFLENFEPTQLFPDVMNSLPPSRAMSPVQDNFQLKKEEGASQGFSNNSLYRNGVAGQSSTDLFTNFVDSSYINMNLQSNGEEGYLHDDLGSLFNM